MHRSPMSVAVSTALCAVLLAGCGLGAQTPAPSPSPVGPPSRDPLVLDRSGGAAELPTHQARMLTKPASGLLSMPWRFLSLTADRREIEVLAVTGDGDCTTPVGFTAERSNAGVTVAALSRLDATKARCVDKLEMAKVLVPLPVRLSGKTELVHAGVDHPWTFPNWSATKYG